MTEMLGKAFVKIRQVDDANSYAGCGFFIDKEYIVTCAHVLDSAKREESVLKNGQFFTGDMPFANLKDIVFELIHFIPVKEDNISFDEFDDLALLKIQVLNKNIAKPQIQTPRPYSENNNPIMLYSHKSKRWVDGQIKAPIEDSWLEISIKSEVEAGDSGSPVWNSNLNAITGMLVARQKNNLTCYMISLWKISKAFEDTVKTLKSSYTLDSPAFPNFQEDQIFIEDILEEIECLLENAEDLRSDLILKLRLSNKANAKELTVELKKQAEENPANPIRSITRCTKRKLNQFDNENAAKKSKSLIEDAEKLVCLISLLDIHEEASKQLHQIPLDITLSQEAPGTAETFVARRIQSYPKYRISKNSPDILGQHAIFSGELEYGIKENSIVDEIEKAVWKLVFPNFAGDKVDSQRLNDQIKYEIQADDREKKNYYFLVLNKRNEKNYLEIPTVRNELKQRLPDLPIITLKHNADSMMFVSSDRALMTAIYDFHVQINTYLPQGQENE